MHDGERADRLVGLLACMSVDERRMIGNVFGPGGGGAASHDGYSTAESDDLVNVSREG